MKSHPVSRRSTGVALLIASAAALWGMPPHAAAAHADAHPAAGGHGAFGPMGDPHELIEKEILAILRSFRAS